jgi:hypothetical protein
MGAFWICVSSVGSRCFVALFVSGRSARACQTLYRYSSSLRLRLQDVYEHYAGRPAGHMRLAVKQLSFGGEIISYMPCLTTCTGCSIWKLGTDELTRLSTMQNPSLC